jgi:hypothetical protein
MKMNVEKTEMMKVSKQPSSVQIMRYQKQPENVGYFLSMITSDAICTREIKPCIALAIAALKRSRFFSPANWT